jgi:hypothetical protein
MNERHGLIKHPTYTSWRGMRQRCTNPKDSHWADYGGRGIRICPEWASFRAFHEWAIASGWALGLTLDRYPDVNGNYEPSNCRWATAQEQGRNKRPRLSVEVDGLTLSVRQWSALTGIFITTLYKRYHAGIRGKEFIAPPVNPATPKGVPTAPHQQTATTARPGSDFAARTIPQP